MNKIALEYLLWSAVFLSIAVIGYCHFMSRCLPRKLSSLIGSVARGKLCHKARRFQKRVNRVPVKVIIEQSREGIIPFIVQQRRKFLRRNKTRFCVAIPYHLYVRKRPTLGGCKRPSQLNFY